MMLQNIEVEEEADDRKLYFNESSGIYYINKDTDIKCCQRAHAKSNECSFSICPSCFSKQVSPKKDESGKRRSKRHKGGDETNEVAGSVTPQTRMAKECHHKLHQLEDLKNLFWCKPEKVGTAEWFQRVTGCNTCNKMYLMCNGTDITVKSEELKEWKFPSLEEMDEYTRSKYKKANADCARSSLNLQDGV